MQQPQRLTMTHRIGADRAGSRLDAFLKSLYKKRSRESLKEAITDGRVSLGRNQGPHLQAGRAKPSTLLLEGDEVRIEIIRRAEPAVNLDYRVIHEDDALLVVDKPAQLPVHPAGSYFFNTLLVHLRTSGYTRNLTPEIDYFLAHRIDRETSGLLVLAKSPAACEALTAQFRERKTQKRYLAVVHGRVADDRLECRASMSKDKASRIRLKMAVVPDGSPDALSAHTEFRVLERGTRYTLVECLPHTGRQHQIRVHLAHLGHPIVGDKIYSLTDEEAARFYDQPFKEVPRPEGAPPVFAPRRISPEVRAKLVIDRHALHNAGIRFNHPVTGESVGLESALPPELRNLVESGPKASGPPLPESRA